MSQRLPKLIPGQMNVIRTILKPGYAEGVRRPARVKAKAIVSQFNAPVLCITLRKAAAKVMAFLVDCFDW
jgi:hypothetical protein